MSVSAPPSPPAAPQGDLFSARALRYSWMLVVGALIGVVWTYFKATREPLSYVSSARMFVSGRVNVPETAGGFSEEYAHYLGTQVEIMRSQEVLDRARQRVELESGQSGAAHIDVRQVPQAAIFSLTSTGPDPAYPRLFLDALMNEFIQFKRERRVSRSENTMDQISAELSRLERQTGERERALGTFKEKHNITYWEQQSVESARILSSLKSREAEVRMRLSILDSWERRATEMAPGRGVEIGPDGGMNLSEAAELVQARTRLDQLAVDREFLLRGLRPSHPKVVMLDAEAERLRRIAALGASRLGERRGEQRLAFQAELEGLQAAILEWEARSLESSRIGAEYEKLSASLARTREVYDRLLSSIQNLDTSKGLDQELVQILEVASPAVRVPLQLRSRLMGGATVGLLGGFALLTLFIRIDERSYSVDETMERLTCRSLAEVPQLPSRPGKSERHRLLVSVFEESFRRLRSLSALGVPEGVVPTLLVTSALPSEGKSEVALNLARAFARSGRRVLLVDADLRRGRLHRALEVGESSPGLCELLSGGAVLDDVLRRTAEPNLVFVAAGRSDGHVNELLSAADLNRALGDMRQICDVLVIDSAPIIPVDDTNHLLAHATRVLFVVRMRHTPMRQAKKAINTVRIRGATDVALVFNRVAPDSGRYYYSYAYHKS